MFLKDYVPTHRLTQMEGHHSWNYDCHCGAHHFKERKEMHVHTHTQTHTPCMQNWLNESWTWLHNLPGFSLTTAVYTFYAAKVFYTSILAFHPPNIFGFSLPKEIPISPWEKCVHSTLCIEEVKCQAFVSTYMWREDHADKLLNPTFWITPRPTCCFRSIPWIHCHFPPDALKCLTLS